MQKWIFALVWVQHAYAFISFALANSLTSVWAKILGGCVWLGIITFLLYSAWKKPVSVEKNTSQEQSKPIPPLPYTRPEDTAQIEDTDEIDKATNWGAFIVAIILIVVLVAIVITNS